MKPKSVPFRCIALIVLAASGSCNNREDGAGIGPGGLQARRSFRTDTVVYDKPMRMFTEAGEITDPVSIGEYRRRHALTGDTAPLAYEHADDVFSTQSETVYFKGSTADAGAGSQDIVVTRQQDTGMYEQGNPQGSITYLFEAEQAFQQLREDILEVRESFTKLERLDDRNYRVRECFHLKGAFESDSMRLPHTFLATRLRIGSYPFALKAGAVPRVPAGDTLLLREGHVAFR